MKLSYTREMVRAALEGDLDSVRFCRDPIFDLNIPERVSGVPTDLLNPRNTWSDKDAYDSKARHLRRQLEDNYDHLEKYGKGLGAASG